MSPIDIKRGYLSPKLNNWYQKVYNSISTSKMVFVGDSTADYTGNASALLGLFSVGTGSVYVNPGDIMDGFNAPTNMPNFGSNGQSLAAWVSDPTISKGLNALIAAAPDLVIFTFGINDTRQNLVTKDQLKTLIITAINSIRSGLPNADIILRMPNSFKIPATNVYIQQGSYASLAAAAQAQTDIIYYAYKELDNYWPNVYLFDSQDLIFGRICQTTSNLMTDDIHPFYAPIIAKMIDTIYPASLKPFSKGLSTNAITQSFPAPYTIYNRSLENTDYYTLITTCRYNTQGSNYIDVSCDDSSLVVSILKRGDIIDLCDSFFINTNTNLIQNVLVQDATHVRFLFYSAVPTNTITAGAFKIYRSKYNNDINTVSYINNRGQYKYIRKVNISGGTNYFDLSIPDNLLNGVLVEYGATNIQASLMQLLTTNIILVAGLTQINLLNAGFIILNDTTLRVGLTGDFSTYAGNAIIVGTQDYEDPFLTKTNIKLLWGFGALTNIYGKVGVKRNGLKYFAGNGEAGVGGLVYIDTSEPTSNTISAISKTYFASTFTFAAGTIDSNELIEIQAEFLLNTGVSPGTLAITAEIGAGQVLITFPTLMLPISTVNMLCTIKVNAYTKAITAGTIALHGNATINLGGVSSTTFNDLTTGAGSGISYSVSNLARLSALFSVAGNTIQMKTMKIFTYNS